MLTIEDIRNPACQSGFSHVKLIKHHVSTRPYLAFAGHTGAGPKTNRWYGKARATAEEAAQDYCDYVNGQQAPPQPALRTAGHKRTRVVRNSDPSVREQQLRAELRQLEAARKGKQGSRGFIYLIAEELAPQLKQDVYIGNAAVKIGWSEAPDGRIAQLQTGNPRKLVLLGTKPGTVEDERALHAKYIRDNVLQEWFRPTQELLSEFGWYINANTSRELWIRRSK